MSRTIRRQKRAPDPKLATRERKRQRVRDREHQREIEEMSGEQIEHMLSIVFEEAC